MSIVFQKLPDTSARLGINWYLGIKAVQQPSLCMQFSGMYKLLEYYTLCSQESFGQYVSRRMLSVAILPLPCMRDGLN